MSAHLLIVGHYTYPVHRERLITGSGSLKTPYEMLSMQPIQDICCDFSRVSTGDHIYFYVVQDSSLQIKVPVLRELYRYLFSSDCIYSRKAQIIQAIRDRLDRIRDPEKQIKEFFENNETYSTTAFRYLLEVLGKPEAELGSGFHGVFQVIDEPYVMEYTTSFHPEKNVYGLEPYHNNMVNNYLWMRIKVKPQTIFPNPISEFTYLDDFTDEVVSWTILYRKLFGKRSCTSFPPIEERKLVRLLENTNADYQDSNEYDNLDINITREYLVGERRFRFKPDWNNDSRGSGIKLSQFVANQIPSNATILPSEGLLESAVLYELSNPSLCVFLDKVSKDILLKTVCYPQERIAWVGNQVVCSAGGSRSDVVTFQAVSGQADDTQTASINVIELKNQSIEPGDLGQAGKYARWLASTYADGNIAAVRHILIGYGATEILDDTIVQAAKAKSKDITLTILTYHMENGLIHLKCHEISK